ncbi:aspartate racemase [Sphaerisporangium krabiense]|uniref:Aspartate racemase n=1 Tax=Sphaerisporangium krabiense TaxID=763782 RepID=A0A7W9DN40_9ACTN|nr:amino acid racemase [Sphaerisporangium krabiense]MBB5625011.1 aspartate racemase [Sphaerisporangium krabiense]GII66949.1 aspartate racemase [Sphaerisporangium krabiense]
MTLTADRDDAQVSGPRLVGVLGGMGPAATVDFYGKLVEETAATCDQGHVPVVIWGDPRVPDRSLNLLGRGEDPTPYLRRGIEALKRAGCEVLAVPCNTAHAFVPRLADEAGLALVSIIEVTADALAADGVRTAGVLATTGTLRAGLYAEALRRRGLTVIEPDEPAQRQVTAAIAAVKSGGAEPSHREALARVAHSLADRGAERIVMACTEIVLALDVSVVPVPALDPARLLARRVADLALGAA